MASTKETISGVPQPAGTELAELNHSSDSLGSMSGDTSVDAHHAGHAFTDTTLALMSYNIGIQNKEVHSGKNWTQKYKRIRADVEAAFTNEAGIQVLLISEFGNMFDDIDRHLRSGVAQPTGNKVHSTCELFEDLLKSIKLSHIHVVADPPYVALIDSECWRVKHHEVLQNLCTKHDIKVQHFILEHVNTSETFRCFNACLLYTSDAADE